jgi:hypothetical protein
MKKIINIVLILIIFIAVSEESPSQEVRFPITVSPLIGDTLSLEERDFYDLFPKIEGFQRTLFYLNPDSSLTAKVYYFKDGDEKEYIMDRYRTLGTFQQYLIQKKFPKETRNEDGAEVIAELTDGTEVAGNLLSARENSLLINGYKWWMKDTVSYNDYISNIKYKNIQSLTVEGNSKILTGMGIGLLVGIGLGVAINSSISQAEKSKFLGGLGRGITAMGVGIASFLIGTLIGITTSTSDEVIEQFSEADIIGLRSYSKYPVEEPDYLKNFK